MWTEPNKAVRAVRLHWELSWEVAVGLCTFRNLNNAWSRRLFGQMVGSLMFGRFKIPNILNFWVFGCLCLVCWPLQWPFTKGTKKRRQCERVCFWRILQIGCLFRVPLYVRACPSSGPTNEERRLKPVVRYRPLGYSLRSDPLRGGSAIFASFCCPKNHVILRSGSLLTRINLLRRTQSTLLCRLTKPAIRLRVRIIFRPFAKQQHY